MAFACGQALRDRLDARLGRDVQSEAERVQTAEAIGVVEVVIDGEAKPLGSAASQIRSAAEKGRTGFKRRAVRC